MLWDVIPLMRPSLPVTSNLIPYLEKIDDLRQYSNFGPLHHQLCLRLADYFGCQEDEICLFANATQAIYCAIRSLEDVVESWIVPNWTFVAPALAAAASGSKISIRDVDEGSWSLPEEPIPSTSSQGLILVCPFGYLPDHWATHEDKAFVLIDAASCFDSCRGIGKLRPSKTVIAISMHATKAFSSGEGGILVGDSDLISRVKSLSNFGYEDGIVGQMLGTNAKLSEYHSAVGLASLDSWEARRSKIQEQTQRSRTISLDLGLENQPSMSTPYITTTWSVRFPNESAVVRFLQIAEKNQIETRRWWPRALSTLKVLDPFLTETAPPTPSSLSLEKLVIGLPFGEHLTKKDYRLLASALEESLNG